ncbi:MAG: precorrin-4 C(11)-methyltransferase [Synechococcales cyanobacterium RM1_1_8]|nr:precorrin-4 C(11)-methyltransferase [Synechococcales cyanobacterium RM1_1_8]
MTTSTLAPSLLRLETQPSPGVYIVGAGPGDPELMTLKALKLLGAADAIFYADSLVPAQLLNYCQPDALKVRTANKTLEEVVPAMVEQVRAGKVVVRLHDGDPCLYGATHEQMAALALAEVPFEVVPGISAYQLAAARLELELTVPGLVQSIILTRISGRTQVPEAEELASLAAHRASLCLYLSARHVEAAQAKLMEHYDSEMPIAVCFRVGWPDERIWQVPLGEMAALTRRENLIRTTMYLISPALAAQQHKPGQVPALGDQDPEQDSGAGAVRSRLYNPDHNHLFRGGA